jgi:hypothetical protein
MHPSQRGDPGVQAAAARLSDANERGLVALAELANEPLVSVDDV